MKVSFILLKKVNSAVKKSLEKQVQEIVCGKFNVHDNNLSIDFEGKSVEIGYSIKSASKRTVDLTLFSDASPTIYNARIYDVAIQNIIKGSHRKDLNIILAYDEASEVFCNNLMPYFAKYERKLRRLIYITITKTLGNDWFDLSFTEEQKKHIKKRKTTNKLLQENFIDELDYGSISTYLFQPISFVSIEELLDGELSSDAIEHMEKSEIVELINKARKKSIWERFFGEYKDIRDLPQRIENLNAPRNIVMHNKTMSATLFDNTKSTLREINKMLDRAIQYAEDKMYTEIERNEVTYSLHNTFETLSMLSAKFAEICEPLKNGIGSVAEVYSNALSGISLDTAGVLDSLMARQKVEYDAILDKLKSFLYTSAVYNLDLGPKNED